MDAVSESLHIRGRGMSTLGFHSGSVASSSVGHAISAVSTRCPSGAHNLTRSSGGWATWDTWFGAHDCAPPLAPVPHCESQLIPDLFADLPQPPAAVRSSTPPERQRGFRRVSGPAGTAPLSVKCRRGSVLPLPRRSCRSPGVPRRTGATRPPPRFPSVLRCGGCRPAPR